ncbi:MAG: UDP-3-O-(3-hydroxymyristoyl)glucosamine N-acyltransferase [Bacteroidales bacterium]|nr:UDP-3-O-(3-hydroxymyristoyl)glucosamine N-acyltransferase [Bacteroidales bacterium]
MEITAKELAQLLSGTIEGNPDAAATTLSRIENGKSSSLCFYANPKYEKYVYSNPAGLLIVRNDFQPSRPIPGTTLIRVEDPYSAVATVLDFVSSKRKQFRRYRGPRCRVRLSAKLGKKVYVGDFSYIGRKAVVGDCTKIYEQVFIGDGTTIGKNCIIYPGVKIYPGMKIGNNVILHSGVVIGSDGFGFAPQPDGTYRKIEHTGDVIIEDDVEIGANTTVDKSQIGTTIIRKGVKIDNLVQVAHNVEIGENTVCCAQTGIAGSAHIGKQCILGGQSGINGHIFVKDGTKVGPKAGLVSEPKKEGMSFYGNPALEYNLYMRSYAIFRRQGKEGLK